MSFILPSWGLLLFSVGPVRILPCTWEIHHLSSFNDSFDDLYVHCLRTMSLQLCLTLCDPVDCNSPDFFVHGILQARILEWGCHLLLQFDVINVGSIAWNLESWIWIQVPGLLLYSCVMLDRLFHLLSLFLQMSIIIIILLFGGSKWVYNMLCSITYYTKFCCSHVLL